MIRKAVERGRFKDARTLAQRARMRSIHYQQFIEDQLFQARRAADRVVWSEDVLPKLDEARAHLSERRKHEVAILESIREHIDHARGDTRDHLVDLKNTIDECRQRHAALFERVMSASEEFRQFQVNAFRARRTQNVPDLEDRILVRRYTRTPKPASSLSQNIVSFSTFSASTVRREIVFVLNLAIPIRPLRRLAPDPSEDVPAEVVAHLRRRRPLRVARQMRIARRRVENLLCPRCLLITGMPSPSASARDA